MWAFLLSRNEHNYAKFLLAFVRFFMYIMPLSKAHRNSFLFIALTLAALVRIPQINGDPPASDISRSGVFLADEGIHGHNALEWVLTGKWYVQDGFNPAVNTPVFTVFEYAWLTSFGVSLATVRYGGLFCGLLALLMVYVLLRKFDRTAAVITVFLGAINFPMIIYNRLALLENPLLCFLLGLALLFMAILSRPSTGGRLFAFWIVFVLGYLTKASIIFFLLVFVFMASQENLQNRKRFFGFSAVYIVLLVTALWIFWISKYPEDWLYYQRFQLNSSLGISLNPFEIIQNYGRYLVHIKLYEFMPVMYVIALLMVVRGTLDLLYKKQRALIERFFVVYFVTGWLLLGFFAYSPPRYSLVLLPAILGFNGLFFAQIFRNDHRLSPWKRSGLSFLIMALVVMLQIGFGLYRVFVYKHLYPSCFMPVLGLLALVLIWFATRGRVSRKLTGWGLLGLILLVQGIQIVRFHTNMESSLNSAIQDVAHIIRQEEEGKNIVLAGDSAPLFAFEVGVPSINVMHREDRLPELVNRVQPAFLLLEDPNELTRLRKLMPNYWQNVTVLKRYRILNNYKHGNDAVLFRIN